MSDPNLPPGTSEKDISGQPCNQCGSTDGCDCEDDGDPRSFRERVDEEKGDIGCDLDR